MAIIFEKLPIELVGKVSCSLDQPADVVHLSQVSHFFHNAYLEQKATIWKHVALNILGEACSPCIAYLTGKNGNCAETFRFDNSDQISSLLELRQLAHNWIFLLNSSMDNTSLLLQERFHRASELAIFNLWRYIQLWLTQPYDPEDAVAFLQALPPHQYLDVCEVWKGMRKVANQIISLYGVNVDSGAGSYWGCSLLAMEPRVLVKAYHDLFDINSLGNIHQESLWIYSVKKLDDDDIQKDLYARLAEHPTTSSFTLIEALRTALPTSETVDLPWKPASSALSLSLSSYPGIQITSCPLDPQDSRRYSVFLRLGGHAAEVDLKQVKKQMVRRKLPFQILMTSISSEPYFISGIFSSGAVEYLRNQVSIVEDVEEDASE